MSSRTLLATMINLITVGTVAGVLAWKYGDASLTQEPSTATVLTLFLTMLMSFFGGLMSARLLRSSIASPTDVVLMVLEQIRAENRRNRKAAA